MNQQLFHLKGILPVLPTPFDAEGKIDNSAMEQLVGFALRSGVDGLVFPGFASEVSELTSGERVELLETVASIVDGRIPVIAGATANSPREVIKHGDCAKSLGLRHLMVQPPLDLGNKPEAVLSFFAEIVEALPETKIILQNAPAPRGSDLSPATILAVSKAIPQIAYIKEETLPAGPAITAILADKPASLLGVIGGGGARYILDEYTRGACAAMPALEIADLHVSMDRAWRKDSVAQARSLYVRTLPLLTLQAIYRMRLTKHVLTRRGVLKHTHVRAPTPMLDASAICDIDNNLAELGLLPTETSPPVNGQ